MWGFVGVREPLACEKASISRAAAHGAGHSYQPLALAQGPRE